MAKVTSKEVAERAGVSIATVSHVLNNTRFVSEETRQRVLDAIEALNYRPNALARGLVTNVTRKIGVVVSEITNPFFTVAVRGIEDELLGDRYNIILCDTDEDPEREKDYLHLLASQQVDGLIIAPTGARSPTLLGLAESGLPTVQLDRRSPELEAPFVGVNSEEGAYQAICHLIGLGHRRIACVINLDVISTQNDRLKGWERALREAHIPIDENLIVRVDPHFYGISSANGSQFLVGSPTQKTRMPSAYESLQGLLKSPKCPSAVFVASNLLALGTLYAFRACGLRCPEDISLISFDDHDWAPLFSPPLTVVRQPAYQLGQSAARLLMKIINGEAVEAPPLHPVELVVRGSCAAPPASAQ